MKPTFHTLKSRSPPQAGKFWDFPLSRAPSPPQAEDSDDLEDSEDEGMNDYDSLDEILSDRMIM